MSREDLLLDLQAEVLQVVLDKPGLTMIEIYNHAQTAENPLQVAAVLRTLLQEEEIKKVGDKHYCASQTITPVLTPDSETGEQTSTQTGGKNQNEGGQDGVDPHDNDDDVSDSSDEVPEKMPEIKGGKQRHIYMCLNRRLTADELVGATGYTKPQLQAQISIMKKRGLVKSERIEGTVFYVRGNGKPVNKPSVKKKTGTSVGDLVMAAFSKQMNKKGAPLSAADIAKITGLKQLPVRNAIDRLRRQGLLKQDHKEGRKTFWTTTSKSATKPNIQKRARKQASKTDGNDPVISILARAVDQAQENLDDYITSVCDPEIIGPLKAARDLARTNLQEYRERSPS